MNISPGGAFCLLLPLLVLTIGTGCSGSATVDTQTLQPDYRRSPSATFHYRVPYGWNDLSGGNSSDSRHVLLSDATAEKSIELREVFVDASSTDSEGGMHSVAQVLAALAQDRDSLELIGEVSSFNDRENEFWIYELRSAGGTCESVVLFSSGELVYEVRLVEGGVADAERGDVQLLKEFVDSLRW